MHKWMVAALAVFILAGIVLAEDVEVQGKSCFWFEGGAGMLSGHTTYQIGGKHIRRCH